MQKSDRPTLRETFAIHLRAVREIHKKCPWVFLAGILRSVLQAVSPYISIYLSARILGELAGQRRTEELRFWILVTVCTTAGLTLLRWLATRFHEYQGLLSTVRFEDLYNDKFLTMDFADVDDQKTRDLFAQIKQNEGWNGWGLEMVPYYCRQAVEDVLGIVSAVVLGWSLFTARVPDTAGVLTILNHPLFLVAIVGAMASVTAFASWLGNQANAAYATLAESSRFGNRVYQRFSYLYFWVKSHEDLRIYNQLDMAEEYMSREKVFGIGSPSHRLINRKVAPCHALASGVSVVFTGLVYLFVCLKAWAGAFGVGSITQYVGAVTALSGNVQSLMSVLGHMQSNTEFLKTLYEFLDIPNGMYQGSLTTEKRADRQYEVVFRNVSFRYPGSEAWALRNVSMKFRVGKRLAIVGENGSGKTTFIKLLCRLYDPQEGQILLNGIDIRKYNYRDYMNIFSIVFQDFQLISQPLGDNVAGSGHYDESRVRQALQDAGFGERLETMSLETFLYRDFGSEGVEISGGEAQKIAIARALYKDAPFIILDEPTAALDPMAEAEIYAKFNDISGDKTAIYISHRLSSCVFCDEIAVFQEGAVIQQGTHEELLAQANGKYHELWNAQAQYYTGEAANQ